MGKVKEETSLGGQQRGFQTTRWSEIQEAGACDPVRRQAGVNHLLQRYWKPVYWCLRRKGYSNDDAKDLTQGFFCEIVLGRELIQQADRTKGRFRTFLLTALDHYVTSIHRKETARKRRPATALASLDVESLPEMPAMEAQASPEHAFHYAWAAGLLDQVLTELRREYEATGRAAYWEIFRAKLLIPILDDGEEPSLSSICAEYGIETEKKASNILITVKRRFATILRQALRQQVQSEAQVEQELGDLVEILSQGGAA